jgi:membrane protein implicated in regulation of membrane protease activity
VRFSSEHKKEDIQNYNILIRFVTMKLKSSFILVFISLSLSSLSVAVLAAPVVHKTTTTSEQQEQSSSSITTGSHEDLQYPAVNKGALKVGDNFLLLI